MTDLAQQAREYAKKLRLSFEYNLDAAKCLDQLADLLSSDHEEVRDAVAEAIAEVRNDPNSRATNDDIAIALIPIIAAHTAKAVATEREACAMIAEGSYLPTHMALNPTWGEASNTRALGIARAIRARTLTTEADHDR